MSAATTSALPVAREDAGNGLLLPGGLWIAADVTLEAKVPSKGPASAEVDDLSLLVRYEPTSRLALFVELRFEDLVTVAEGQGTTTGDGDLSVERLYAEALLTPTVTARVGKVFTPFGLWNEVRRAPLTWTVEEPAAIDAMFPEHATGLTLRYQTTWRAWSLDATAYGPAQDELTFRRSDEKGWMVGTRVAADRTVGTVFGSLGLNAAEFRGRDHSAWTTTTGLDLELAVAGHHVTGEVTYRIPAGGEGTVYGSYVQDVVPLSRWVPNLYAVVRLEQFQPRRGSTAIGQLVGLFWRPLPWLIVRTDYLFATRRLERLEPGLHASLSVLL